MPSDNSTTSQPVQTTTVAAPQNSAVYASIGDRFLAVTLDGIFLFLILVPIAVIFVVLSALVRSNDLIVLMINFVHSLVNIIILFGYQIYFIGSKGQTPGKMIMKVKVLKLDTKAVPGYMTAFVRDLVKNFISSILLLGYITAFNDPQKRTWHDKIAGTVVVKA